MKAGCLDPRGVHVGARCSHDTHQPLLSILPASQVPGAAAHREMQSRRVRYARTSSNLPSGHTNRPTVTRHSSHASNMLTARVPPGIRGPTHSALSAMLKLACPGYLPTTPTPSPEYSCPQDRMPCERSLPGSNMERRRSCATMRLTGRIGVTVDDGSGYPAFESDQVAERNTRYQVLL